MDVNNRLAGPGVFPNSDGTTFDVPREDTQPIFDQHRRKNAYPHNLDSYDYHKRPDLMKEKLENVSMLKEIPPIDPAKVDQDLNKLGDLEWQPTYKHIVERDINKME